MKLNSLRFNVYCVSAISLQSVLLMQLIQTRAQTNEISILGVKKEIYYQNGWGKISSLY